MPAQLITVIAPASRHAPSSIAPTYYANPPIRSAAPPPIEPTVASMLDQLAQTLTILRDTAGQVLEGTITGSTTQTLQRCLTPTARQAEAVVQSLRALSLAKTALVIDLSQALTVLVLAADLLAHNRLTAPTNLDLYVLLRRNAERALPCLDILSRQLVSTI